MKKIIISIITISLAGYASAQEYSLKGKLICNENVCPTAPGCGTFAFAVAYKFEIVSTDYKTSSKYIVAMIECPELHGGSFFKSGDIYEMTLIPKSEASFSWSIINDYEKENLPTLWVKEIRPPGINK